MEKTTSGTPRRKRNETIAAKVIGRVIHGKYEPAILNELSCLAEHIEKKNYSSDEIAKYIPHFASRTYPEMVMIQQEVYHQLATRLKNSDLTFLQTYRVYIAMMNMKPDKHIPLNSPRIKFCAKFYMMDNAPCLRDSLKTIALIDITPAPQENNQ